MQNGVYGMKRKWKKNKYSCFCMHQNISERTHSDLMIRTAFSVVLFCFFFWSTVYWVAGNLNRRKIFHLIHFSTFFWISNKVHTYTLRNPIPTKLMNKQTLNFQILFLDEVWRADSEGDPRNLLYLSVTSIAPFWKSITTWKVWKPTFKIKELVHIEYR